jgi:hypothetical protein
MAVITVSKNILESSTVSLTAGTAHADFPLARIANRNITDLFKCTAAETTEIQVDQGATGNIAIAACIIASGHNLDGETIDIQYSDDAAIWNDAVTQFTGTAGHIIQTFTESTHRYWRVKITTPANAVEITEIFFSPIYTWETDPVYPLSDLEPQNNIEVITSSKGENYYLQKGLPKSRRAYTLKNINITQRDNLLALWADWGGHKPFWISDHEGTLLYAEFSGGLNLNANLQNYYSAQFTLLEVLAA